ncbi:hypothetical protein [uncultured Ilyobacter sp.]|uniref:hypothetical protein n=1 Tax=uncultured Ilyobacter sp. TaxID=544433 RepID=UPI0029F5CB75|nr:hypothetical protein [uncultured Ilyobacter sp.]
MKTKLLKIFLLLGVLYSVNPNTQSKEILILISIPLLIFLITDKNTYKKIPPLPYAIAFIFLINGIYNQLYNSSMRNIVFMLGTMAIIKNISYKKSLNYFFWVILMYIGLVFINININPEHIVEYKYIGNFVIKRRIYLNMHYSGLALNFLLLYFICEIKKKSFFIKFISIFGMLFLGKLSPILTIFLVELINYFGWEKGLLKKGVNLKIMIVFFNILPFFLLAILNYANEEILKLFTKRDLLYKNSYQIFKDYGFIEKMIGKGDIDYAVAPFTYHPHNQFLHILLMFGLLGFIGFLFMNLKIADNLLENKDTKEKKIYFKLLLALLIIMQLDDYLVWSVFSVIQLVYYKLYCGSKNKIRRI